MTTRKPKATDTAAQIKAADVDLQKQEQSSTDVGNQVEETPSPTELIRDNPDIFGEETTTEEDSTNEDVTPQDRRPETNGLTSDEIAAATDGEPNNEPAKTTGKQIAIGSRVMLTTANPIGGQTTNPAFVVGFNAVNGKANLRLELTDGGRAKAVDFGGVPQDKADEERGAYWEWPIDSEKLDEAKADASE